MSEKNPEAEGPEPLSGDPSEMMGGPPSDDLVKTFRSSGGPNNYVAEPAPGYDVHGFWHCFGATSRTGYATHAVALHWTLDRILGVPAQLVPHRYHDIDIDQFPDDRSEMLFEWTKNAVGHPHALFCSYPPDVGASMSELGPPLIPYCAFEGTKISRYVAELCNSDSFAETWVVSPFVHRAFIDAGVNPSKVHVVEPGLWGGPWEGMGYSVEQLASAAVSPVSPDDPFTFGALGTWHSRKGFDRLVEAYFQAFKREDPVQLVIRTSVFGKNKTISEFKEELTSEIAAIAAKLGDSDFPKSKAQPKIKLLLGTDATDAEIIEWLGSLDCYANATYGEGLGIPHIWAKCQGVPVLSSGYGAVGEMLSAMQDLGATEDFVYPFHLAQVDPEMPKLSMLFERDTEWGDYETDDLVQAMQMQFERGRRVDRVGADLARHRFSFERMELRVRELLLTLSDVDIIDRQVLADLGLR